MMKARKARIRSLMHLLRSNEYYVQHGQQSQSPFPWPMAHRAAPISVSIALGHESANAVKATAGGWSTGSSASLTSHSILICRATDEKAMSTKSMVWLGQSEADALPLGHNFGMYNITAYNCALLLTFYSFYQYLPSIDKICTQKQHTQASLHAQSAMRVSFSHQNVCIWVT